jgi:hypothetical protein
VVIQQLRLAGSAGMIETDKRNKSMGDRKPKFMGLVIAMCIAVVFPKPLQIQKFQRSLAEQCCHNSMCAVLCPSITFREVVASQGTRRRRIARGKAAGGVEQVLDGDLGNLRNGQFSLCAFRL